MLIGAIRGLKMDVSKDKKEKPKKEKDFQEIRLIYDRETYQEIIKKLQDKMAIEGLDDYSECIRRLVL